MGGISSRRATLKSSRDVANADASLEIGDRRNLSASSSIQSKQARLLSSSSLLSLSAPSVTQRQRVPISEFATELDHFDPTAASLQNSDPGCLSLGMSVGIPSSLSQVRRNPDQISQFSDFPRQMSLFSDSPPEMSQFSDAPSHMRRSGPPKPNDYFSLLQLIDQKPPESSSFSLYPVRFNETSTAATYQQAPTTAGSTGFVTTKKHKNSSGLTSEGATTKGVVETEDGNETEPGEDDRDEEEEERDEHEEDPTKLSALSCIVSPTDKREETEISSTVDGFSLFAPPSEAQSELCLDQLFNDNDADDDADGNQHHLVFSTSMPTRIESMHALEHSLLRVFDATKPGTLLYSCPLCDEKLWKPQRYRNLYAHYLQAHWTSRVYVGEYVCFPCCRIHSGPLTQCILENYQFHQQQQQRSLQLKDSDEPMVRSEKKSANDRADARRRKEFQAIVKRHPDDLELHQLVSSGLYGMPAHYHCPSWTCSNTHAYTSTKDLEEHCRRSHSHSSFDPWNTPEDPTALHAPLLDATSIDILPLRTDELQEATSEKCSNDDEEDEDDDDDEDDEDSSVVSEASTRIDPLFRLNPRRSLCSNKTSDAIGAKATCTFSVSSPLHHGFSFSKSSSPSPTHARSIAHPSSPQPPHRRIRLKRTKIPLIPEATGMEHRDTTKVTSRSTPLIDPSPVNRVFHSLIGSPALRSASTTHGSPPFLLHSSHSNKSPILHSCLSSSSLVDVEDDSSRCPDNGTEWSSSKKASQHQRRGNKRVRFSSQVYQVTFDKNRSKVEKYGSTLGPTINDMQGDAGEVAVGSELNHGDEASGLIQWNSGEDVERTNNKRRSRGFSGYSWIVEGDSLEGLEPEPKKNKKHRGKRRRKHSRSSMNRQAAAGAVSPLGAGEPPATSVFARWWKKQEPPTGTDLSCDGKQLNHNETKSSNARVSGKRRRLETDDPN